MTRKQYTDEQTISILKEHEAGMPAQDARPLRGLEDENRRLKRMVADLSLDKQMLEDVIKASKDGSACDEASRYCAFHSARQANAECVR